jgi:tRNA (guanine10-N2)-methyltransferase
MESEASLLMANQALANPGKWIYDPFAGTGSLLLTASAFGACTFGSDIDGRQIRGKSACLVLGVLALPRARVLFLPRH